MEKKNKIDATPVEDSQPRVAQGVEDHVLGVMEKDHSQKMLHPQVQQDAPQPQAHHQQGQRMETV